MEKEINELKELVSDLKELFDGKENVNEKLKKQFYKAMEKAIKEPCEIIVKKDKDGYASCKIEGYRLPLLIALAGAEKNILEKLNSSEGEFEFIKSYIGCKEEE